MAQAKDHLKDIMWYAEGVTSGEIDVCKYIKLICKDFLKNLNDRSHKYKFDEAKANRAINFIENMKHVKGEWAGKNLTLEPWQKWFVGNIFGWVDKTTGLRRYREAALIVSRKSAKSTLAAAIAHYMLVGENEKGAEVYCGATTEEQAFVLFNIARDMVIANTQFQQAFGLTYTKETISCEKFLSRFRPIIGSPKDGSNPQCAVVDELHEHPDDRLYDSLKLGMGARKQPLLLVTTTAGVNVKGPGYRYVQAGRRLVQGLMTNERMLYMEFTIDEEDDWKDFSCWKKASPNFGVSVSEEFLQEQYQMALNLPAKRSHILTKMLNVWNNESVGWLDFQKWVACGDDSLNIEDFAGEDCWIGIDLASRLDLTSMMAVFKREDSYYVFGKHYLPSETVNRPENDTYRSFAADGWLTVTEGVRTDFHALEEDLQNWSDLFKIREVVYDAREAEYLMQNIREWAYFPCIEFVQSAANFSAPMKEMEAAYLSGLLKHQNDAVVNWCAGNVILKSTTSKLIYPAKQQNDQKIDPIVALIMAFARCMENAESTPESNPFIMFL